MESTNNNPDLKIKYKVGEPIKSKAAFAPLFVFSKLYSAINFSNFNVYSGRIFECKIKESKREWGIFLNSEISLISKRKKQKKGIRDIVDFDFAKRAVPDNTVFADSVTLTKEVLDFPDRIFYKVVTIDLRSAVSIASHYNLDVTYRLGHRTYPRLREAPLMVFNILEDAKRFLTIENKVERPLEIYRCHIEKSNMRWKPMSNFALADVLNYIKIGKQYNIDSYGEIGPQPHKITLADSVTLLEKVS
jgi:hypothetical protein